MEIKKAVKYRVTCPHCGSVITFEIGEIDFSNQPFHKGGWIICPHCHCNIQTHEYWYSNDRFELNQGYVTTIFEGEEEKKYGMRPPEEDKL